MAKIDMQAVTKALAYGAGAVAVPALVSGVTMLQGLLSNQIMGFEIFGGITVGGIVLAGVGVLLVDQLVYGR